MEVRLEYSYRGDEKHPYRCYARDLITNALLAEGRHLWNFESARVNAISALTRNEQEIVLPKPEIVEID